MRKASRSAGWQGRATRQSPTLIPRRAFPPSDLDQKAGMILASKIRLPRPQTAMSVRAAWKFLYSNRDFRPFRPVRLEFLANFRTRWRHFSLPGHSLGKHKRKSVQQLGKFLKRLATFGVSYQRLQCDQVCHRPDRIFNLLRNLAKS